MKTTNRRNLFILVFALLVVIPVFPFIIDRLGANGRALGVLLATTYATVLLTTGIFTCSITFLRPSIPSLPCKRTTIGQGASMGLSNSFASLGRIVGPVVAGVILDINPNYPYLSGALILCSVFLTSLIWVRPTPDELKVMQERP